MKTASDIIAAGYAPDVAPVSDIAYEKATQASNPAVLTAAIKLYEAAGLIRALPGLTPHDIVNVLLPGLEQLQRQVKRAADRAALPAIEKPEPSVIQRGEDKTADFLRAVSSGAEVRVADAKEINAQIDREAGR